MRPDRLRRLTLLVVVGASMLVAAGLPAAAQAKHRCGTVVLDDGTEAKAIVWRGAISCHVALRIAETYFNRVATHRNHWDGRFADGSIYYRAAHSYRCGTGLGASQGFCYRGRNHVDVSVRDDDGWSF
jgi:hypothetical protein